MVDGHRQLVIARRNRANISRVKLQVVGARGGLHRHTECRTVRAIWIANEGDQRGAWDSLVVHETIVAVGEFDNQAHGGITRRDKGNLLARIHKKSAQARVELSIDCVLTNAHVVARTWPSAKNTTTRIHYVVVGAISARVIADGIAQIAKIEFEFAGRIHKHTTTIGPRNPTNCVANDSAEIERTVSAACYVTRASTTAL